MMIGNLVTIFLFILCGPNIKTAVSILNCILARQLCFEDPSCSAILEIIPRVCGPVPVACSTVTVTKCQAALKTLQAFPFFRPTCLCKEPGADPECNNFRDFLFDHPCGFVLKKEKDPYPVDALPTCNHALSVCQQERKCIKLFENFKTHCKVRENKCRMEDRDLCYESWTNLRLSPMFGCICPNNHMKRRCDRIFSMVNHNPCVDVVLLSPAQDVSKLDNIAPLPSLLSPLAQTSTKKSLTHFFHDDSHNQSQKLSSSNNRMFPIALASHSPEINFYIKTHNRNDTNQKSPQINPLLTISTNSKEHDSRTKNLNTNLHNHNSNNNNNNNNNGNKNSSRNNTAYDNKNNNYKINNNTNNNNNNKLPKNRHRHLNKNTEYYQSTWNPPHNIMEIVQSISVDDTSYHQHLFDENMALIEMPLIAPVSMHYPHHRHNVYYPYNITGFQNQIHQHFDNTDGGTISSVERHQSAPDLTPDTHTEIIRIHFQSTCHTALDACREDQSCASSVQPVMQHCDLHRCNRNACMDALQSFYRGSHEDLSLDVAFCLCKKTSNRHDVCMIAQEKLHPVCAQRPPDTLNTQTSNGAMYHPPPACNVVADLCKEDEECRARLEHYEQACAVDSVTKKCAGRTSSCRSAMLGILGTPLRTSCACQGADVQQLYECLGWHRLLWINPCVVESQKDFHMKRLAELGLLITSTTSTTTRQPTTLATTHITMGSIAVQRPTRPPTIFIPKSIIIESIPPTEQALENNYIELPLPDSIPETLLYGNEQNENISRMGAAASGEKLLVLFTNSTTMEIETTSTTTTTTTMASTAAPRFCVVQRPQQSDQLIPESSTRRIYSLDDAECSELCSCANTLTLTCHALCVPFAPCRTKLAYYNHASPAYQAYRGRCLCYSGRFICMKPPIGDYSLPGGIFLFLGYSSTDEALLRPYTNLGIQDTIRVLQHYVNKHISNQTACTLNLFNMTDENIIISARLPHDSKITPMELLRNEKAQCTPILETISHQVNSQHSELAAQRLLSIFKMAEVETVLPDVSHACRQLLTTKHTFSFSIISVVIYLIMPLLVRWSYHIQLVQWT